MPDKATGKFKANIPQGKYVIISGGRQQTLTFMPGAMYHVECCNGFMLNYGVTKHAAANGEVKITLTAQGSGNHSFNPYG